VHGKELTTRDREADAREREILRLHLDNALLRFERRLPSTGVRTSRRNSLEMTSVSGRPLWRFETAIS
jgi:hypothetical protein